jgi:mRNA interferase MazF
VCVLSRDEAIPVLGKVLVAEATTTIRGIPTEVPLDEADGMPQSCVLSLDNLDRARKGALTDRITTLSPAKMHEVCEALAFATGCWGPSQSR